MNKKKFEVEINRDLLNMFVAKVGREMTPLEMTALIENHLMGMVEITKTPTNVLEEGWGPTLRDVNAFHIDLAYTYLSGMMDSPFRPARRCDIPAAIKAWSGVEVEMEIIERLYRMWEK